MLVTIEDVVAFIANEVDAISIPDEPETSEHFFDAGHMHGLMEVYCYIRDKQEQENA